MPRRIRLYASRAIYPTVFFILTCTAWMVLAGTQLVRNVGDFARFGDMLFQILAPLQLALAVFFAALFSASAAAQEKDRRTFVLLLLTRMTSSELVLGKLFASMLTVFVLLGAALPLFMLSLLFGGVSLEQVTRTFAVTLASALAAGSLGSTMALWREKTYQALAMTVLTMVFWLAFWQIASYGTLGSQWIGTPVESWAICFSPWQAVLAATRPFVYERGLSFALIDPVTGFLCAAIGIAGLLNLVAIVRVRVWNSSRATRQVEEEQPGRVSIWGAEHDVRLESEQQRPTSAPGASEPARSRDAAFRRVWNNPIIWREMRTWAQGRKIIAIRLAYLVLFAMTAAVVYFSLEGREAISLPSPVIALVPLFVLSLVLVNAQAVTSLTTERDGRALDLLLVTDLTPKEFIYGKLGGVFYNTKEMVVLPILLCAYLYLEEQMSLEHLLYLLGGLASLYAFVGMLGIHAGMTYENSRSAVGVSLGTVFFLTLGVTTCMWMIRSFAGSFEVQLQPFLAFMVGGGVGLYFALGARNPSRAIFAASMLCPFATFYAITSYLLDAPLAVFFVTVGTYGFATASMLIPAIYEFDVATGRTTGEG